MTTDTFLVRVNGTVGRAGRLFRITVTAEPENDWTLVDCRDCHDSRTSFEAQAILDGTTAGRDAILADSQVRDAIASAYYNATSYERGNYPVGGTHLPEGFAVTPI